jgi:hypothetical protein
MWLFRVLDAPNPTTYLMVRLKQVVGLAKMIFNHFYVIDRAHSLRMEIVPNNNAV